MSEPAAWRFARKNFILYQRRKPEEGSYKEGTLIPLYTNPAKTLTDDEIHELANEHLRTQNQDGAKVVLGLEEFARAILRKAQEK
jgi:hypothetical protein